ncbi:group-specific protein [Bacillus sp. NTK071]|uniref:group-specific protein n=1 Tax=Bacillus sp. NTK071 TaxID=2802175 RepID=UPI001A8FE3B2|nr:group-specific protein [Bacillus sp. NTK071]
MGKCTIDYSYGDVLAKLEDQSDFMPDALVQKIYKFLHQTLSQETLNELFHLLKKYDLASKPEKEKRNHEIENMTKR